MSYIVRHIASIPGRAFTVQHCNSLEQAVKVQETLAAYDLHLAERRLRDDEFSNTSWIEVWDLAEDDWVELDDGGDIEALLEEERRKRSRILFEALGAASSCWENLSGAGVFESARCKAIGEEAFAALFPTPHL